MCEKICVMHTDMSTINKARKNATHWSILIRKTMYWYHTNIDVHLQRLILTYNKRTKFKIFFYYCIASNMCNDANINDTLI